MPQAETHERIDPVDTPRLGDAPVSGDDKTVVVDGSGRAEVEIHLLVPVAGARIEVERREARGGEGILKAASCLPARDFIHAAGVCDELRETQTDGLAMVPLLTV